MQDRYTGDIGDYVKYGLLRPLAHGEGFLSGSWAKSVANNAEVAQSAVWLPVHMGNVGLGTLWGPG